MAISPQSSLYLDISIKLFLKFTCRQVLKANREIYMSTASICFTENSEYTHSYLEFTTVRIDKFLESKRQKSTTCADVTYHKFAEAHEKTAKKLGEIQLKTINQN